MYRNSSFTGNISPKSPKSILANAILDLRKRNARTLYTTFGDIVHHQIGNLPLSDAALDFVAQIPGILKEWQADGILPTDPTHEVNDSLLDLRATLGASPGAFSGYAGLKANSISQGSLEISRGPLGRLSVKVWRRNNDGYEIGLGRRGCVLDASPAMSTCLFAVRDAEIALAAIRDILRAPDVLVRAGARKRF